MRYREDVALYMTPFKLSDAWEEIELSGSMSRISPVGESQEHNLPRTVNTLTISFSFFENP